MSGHKLSEHPFAVGLFCANRWGGNTQTTAPERWDASWANNLLLAQQAEAAGVDFLLPLGIWRSLGGAAATDGHSYEPITWAAGLLAATRAIKVFATVHVSFLHPILATKQFVTCDHIGAGRFGLNIVSGSNKPEFDMFGVELLEHDERYVFTEEWLDIVQRLWSEPAPFEHHGRYFTLAGAQSDPKPFQGNRPIIVSAGSSGAGREFAARRADALFMIVLTETGLAQKVQAFREASSRGADVLCSGHLFCRRTRREAQDYYDHIVHDHGDWAAAEALMNDIFPNGRSIPADRLQAMRERFCSGFGTYRLLGDPDDIVDGFRRLHAAGLSGMAFGLPNFLEDFPIIRDEVLPRMARAELRRPATA